MANIVILTGIITEISELQRDGNGKEWINFKLKVLNDSEKETVIPCSASGGLAMKLDSHFYEKDKVEVTGLVSSIERISKVGNVYHELKIYANKVVYLTDNENKPVNDKSIEKKYVESVEPRKQAFPTELGDLEDELPF